MERECWQKYYLLLEKTAKLPDELEKEISDMESRCTDSLLLRNALNSPRYSYRNMNFTRKEDRCWMQHFLSLCGFCESKSCVDGCIRKADASFDLPSCNSFSFENAKQLVSKVDETLTGPSKSSGGRSINYESKTVVEDRFVDVILRSECRQTFLRVTCGEECTLYN